MDGDVLLIYWRRLVRQLLWLQVLSFGRQSTRALERIGPRPERPRQWLPFAAAGFPRQPSSTAWLRAA